MPKAKRREGFQTIAAVVKALNLSAWKVRELAKTGELASERIGGVLYFPNTAIGHYALSHGSSKARAIRTPAGELAAIAFEMLAGGKPPVDLVLKLRMTPETARELVQQYNELRELEVSRPSQAMCASCGNHPARYCAGCVAPQPASESAKSEAAPTTEERPRRSTPQGAAAAA